MATRATALRFAILVPLVLLIVAATTLLGPPPLTGTESYSADAAQFAFWHLRVPRCVLAACAGAGLAVGGVIFQTLFRNPLAEPYTLGVASGASLAAALGFLYGWRGDFALGVPSLALVAFAGAALAMGVVYLMSRLRPGRDMARLLLAGVCVAYVCSAGILLVFHLADKTITSDTVVWMMGSLGAYRPRAGLEIAVVLVPVLAFATYSHRALDLLHFGDDLAAARGVNVPLTVWGCYALVGVLTAAIVANCGPIGFVGLMVPHIGRAIFGLRTLPLLLGAALVGAAFLAVCDGIARSMPVTELPVGVVTNILGAAFFLYLLATRDVAPAMAAR